MSIYDRDTPHLNLELDTLKENDFIQALLVDIRIKKEQRQGTKEVYLEPEIFLSLKNSKIKKCKQMAVEEESAYVHCFYRLGIAHLTSIMDSCCKDIVIGKEDKQNTELMQSLSSDENFKDIYTLNTLVEEIGIAPFASGNYSQDYFVYHNNMNFSYTKIRDYQNIEWSEQSVAAGAQQNSLSNSARALECYNNAVELDPLNKQAYIARGDFLANQEKFEDAIKEFRKALTLDPENDEAKEHINVTMKRMKESEEKKKDQVIVADQSQYEIRRNDSHFLQKRSYKMNFDNMELFDKGTSKSTGASSSVSKRNKKDR